MKVDINRPEFMFNPTNCETQAVSASLSGQPASSAEAAGGRPAERALHRQRLRRAALQPRLHGRNQLHVTKLDGLDLHVMVTQRPGEAAIHKVELELPEALPSRNETLNKACTEQQFAANPAGCPKAAIMGTATAHTPCSTYR